MKKKVLIIENDVQIRDIVGMILDAEGYETHSVPYAPEDIKQVNADLILLDEWINRADGHMLCKQLKSFSELAEVPVIIFSTADNIKDIVKTCGADGYVQKPFDLEVLLAEIMRLLPNAPVSSI